MAKPEEIFRAEKERAVTSRNSQHARLLAEAKAAFDKLMAEGQAARKSGRPRKHPLPPLKTSSSRTPPRPPAELRVAIPPSVPVARPEPKAAAPATKTANATKPAAKAPAKHVQPRPAGVKRSGKSAKARRSGANAPKTSKKKGRGAKRR